MGRISSICREKKCWECQYEECLFVTHEREHKKEYYLQNKDKCIERVSKWQSENKDKCKEYQQKWEEKNKEHLQEYRHNYYLKRKLKNAESNNSNPVNAT